MDVLALCCLLVFGTHIYKAAFYVMLSLLIVLLLACVIFLSLQPQSERVLVFRTPFVPFLPITAFFCNIYLMLELRKLTWLRMLVWLFIGMAYLQFQILNSFSVFCMAIATIGQVHPSFPKGRFSNSLKSV